MTPLTPTQAEILKLFKNFRSENDLQELKVILSNYLAQKVTYEADKAFEEKKYTVHDIDTWKKDHTRTKAS